ncbi:MAG: hypothetical protein ACK5L6_11210 [Anaerorhabdus sp.]|uniref:hypothetical protein n=1 Tax=Anaerorhabdus sp. TaxID=1872524 RepID=UPI003A8C1485
MKINITSILKGFLPMILTLTLVGCSATPTQPTQTPTTDDNEIITEGNTLLIPLFVKDGLPGVKYNADTAQVQVTITSNTIGVNTLTALDIRAFYDASLCGVGKECTVQVQLEIVNNTIDANELTLTPNITEATVMITK